ncbi:MAG: hypothetical protein GWP91_05965 [Rhodobacterales bacterium]|nr:hypothetical protein [Rhodobacterales bacterium]
MAIRETLASLLGGSRPSDLDIRQMVNDAVAAQSSGDNDNEALEAEIAQLKKKLNMAMGAVQAATAQLMALKTELTNTNGAVKQATQHATTAKATAEAAADGLTAVEARMDALVEKLGTASAPTKKKPAAKKKAAPKKAASKKTGEAHPENCSVDGCDNEHRARGYCAKHYQQWKRGTLS